MGEHDCEGGMAFEEAADNEPCCGDGGFQRKADNVPEVEIPEAIDVSGVLRMEEYRHFEPGGGGEDRLVARIVEIAATNMCALERGRGARGS